MRLSLSSATSLLLTLLCLGSACGDSAQNTDSAVDLQQASPFSDADASSGDSAQNTDSAVDLQQASPFSDADASGGDSAQNTDSAVDLQQASPFSDADAGKLVKSVWKRETSARYTAFLEINPDRSSGFLCHNDGKSVSGAVAFEEINGRTVMVGQAGHGEGPMFREQVSFEGDKLVTTGAEKGQQYVGIFRPILALPEICQRLQRGEKPTIDEYLASWDADAKL